MKRSLLIPLIALVVFQSCKEKAVQNDQITFTDSLSTSEFTISLQDDDSYHYSRSLLMTEKDTTYVIEDAEGVIAEWKPDGTGKIQDTYRLMVAIYKIDSMMFNDYECKPKKK